MKCIAGIVPEDVILGQYVADPKGTGDATLGYLDDPTVPKGNCLLKKCLSNTYYMFLS